jgi:hypothetical protein
MPFSRVKSGLEMWSSAYAVGRAEVVAQSQRVADFVHDDRTQRRLHESLPPARCRVPYRRAPTRRSTANCASASASLAYVQRSPRCDDAPPLGTCSFTDFAVEARPRFGNGRVGIENFTGARIDMTRSDRESGVGRGVPAHGGVSRIGGFEVGVGALLLTTMASLKADLSNALFHSRMPSRTRRGIARARCGSIQ